MKKFATLSLLLVTAITLTGCTLTEKLGLGKNTSQNTQSNGEKLSGTIEDLMKLGKKVSCTFTSKMGDNETTGTTYVNGNKARSEIKMKAKGDADAENAGEEINVEINSIVDGDWLYTWGSNMPAMKMQMSVMKKAAEDIKSEVDATNKDTSPTSDLSQKFDYSCKSWNVDNSKFELPKDVTFTDATDTFLKLKDLSKQLEGAKPTNVDSVKNAACSACEMAPDQATKDECKKNIGC